MAAHERRCYISRIGIVVAPRTGKAARVESGMQVVGEGCPSIVPTFYLLSQEPVPIRTPATRRLLRWLGAHAGSVYRLASPVRCMAFFCSRFSEDAGWQQDQRVAA